MTECICGANRAVCVDCMEAENAALRKERDDLAAELGRVNRLCNSLRAENERLSNFVTDQNGVIVHLHKEIDKLRAEVERLRLETK